METFDDFNRITGNVRGMSRSMDGALGLSGYDL